MFVRTCRAIQNKYENIMGQIKIWMEYGKSTYSANKETQTMTQIQWSEYPEGTKVYATTGGHWVRMRRGWKWCTGTAIFPRPGADYFKIELPS